MTSKKLLPAVFALSAIMLFGAVSPAFAQQAVQADQRTTFATTEQIILEDQLKNILDTQQLVEIESQKELTFVALEDKVLVLNEKEELVAIIAEKAQLTQITVSDDVRLVQVPQLRDIQKLATDNDSTLVIVQKELLTVVDTEKIITEQVPRVVELSVADDRVFWTTSNLELRDATIIEDKKDIIALTVDGKAHLFQALNTQSVQYQQIPTSISSLEKVIVNAIAIDELNGVVAIVDEKNQLVVIQTKEILENNIESVISVQTVATPTQVEIVAADPQKITKIVVVEDEALVEKFSVDMRSEKLVDADTIEMALTTLVEDVRVQDIASPIAITLDKEGKLLALFADNRIAEYEHLKIELQQPTNAITSSVQIVRSDMPAVSSCSVNIVEGNVNYGQVTIGEVAETQLVLQTVGNPQVSVMGSEWLTADGEVVMNADATHYKLVTAQLGEELRYDDMEELATAPETSVQVLDSQVAELFLQLQVPETFDRESLDAEQTVAVFAEC